MKNLLKFIPILMILILISTAFSFGETEDLTPEPQEVEFINNYLAVLSIEDDQERLDALIPLLYARLVSENGTELHNNSRMFYKRACEHVSLYLQPAEVIEVRDGIDVEDEGYPKGHTVIYVIKKKEEGEKGEVFVFRPEDGGELKIFSLGSL